MYRVLIVDDEFPARSMVKLVLDWESNGFEIIGEAKDGKEALEKCRMLRPDLVITDIQMPVMDGIEFIRHAQMLENPPHFIILSCYESFSYAQQAIKLGVCDYLIKDLLTTGQLQNTLNAIVPKLKAIGILRPAKTATTVISREFEADFDKLKTIYPAQLSLVERRLERLFSHLFTRNITAAKTELNTLYRQNFSGIAQYNYLNYINSLLFNWILDECLKHEIDRDLVFQSSEIPSDILLNSTAPDDAYTSFCSWIDALNNLLGERPKYSSRIQKVIDYLLENYCLDIGLTNIADHFNIHKVHLARTFKAETGTTLVDYLNMLRIQKAKMLLCISDYKINEIVYIVGYNNPQNFYTLFKKHVQCSPTEYRNQFSKS